MHRVLLLVFIALAGCAASKQTDAPRDAARIISLTTLPPLTSPSAADGVRLDVMFLVRPDGTVSDVRIIGSGAGPEWDRAAADSMRLWTFAIGPGRSSDEAIWVRTNVIVQVQQPTIMTLAQLTAGSRREADSLHALLAGGLEFETLAREIYRGETHRCEWFLGSVNIARYPTHIRTALEALAVHEFTSPLQIDSRYTIYMRLEPSHR